MSRRCKGGSVSAVLSFAIPTPAAVTISGYRDEDGVHVLVMTAPSLPDTDGVWSLSSFDIITGEWQVQANTSALESSLAPAEPFELFTTSDILFKVIQHGGGIDFDGPSPDSNIIEIPLL